MQRFVCGKRFFAEHIWQRFAFSGRARHRKISPVRLASGTLARLISSTEKASRELRARRPRGKQVPLDHMTPAGQRWALGRPAAPWRGHPVPGPAGQKSKGVRTPVARPKTQGKQGSPCPRLPGSCPEGLTARIRGPPPTLPLPCSRPKSAGRVGGHPVRTCRVAARRKSPSPLVHPGVTLSVRPRSRS